MNLGKEFGVILREEGLSQRGLIREARGTISPPFSRRMCSEGTSGCRWRDEEAAIVILVKRGRKVTRQAATFKTNRIKVLRESGSPLLICSFVTPKVHHGVSHPSSGQSVACASASSHQYMRRVLSSGRFPRRVVTGRRVSFCCCYVASVVSDSVRPYGQQPTRFLRPQDSLGKNTGVGCHFLLQCPSRGRISFIVFFKLFVYFWLHWVFIAAHGLSLAAARLGCSLLRCTGFSLLWLLLLPRTDCRARRFSSCGFGALECWLSICGPRA